MKHNIQTTTPQTMTASEIENLALHILALKGNYDFTGTNLTITPPTDMDADVAAIIVKCAQMNGGTININGASPIDDSTWEIIKQLSCPLWCAKHPTVAAHLFKLYQQYSNIKDFVASCGLDIPRFSTNASTANEKKWWVRNDVAAYTNWNKLDNIMSQSWSNGYGRFGAGRGTIVKFFKASSIPTGFKYAVAVGWQVYVNGTKVYASNEDNGLSGVEKTFDFTNIIKTDEVNFVVAYWIGTGSHRLDFGFIGGE